MTTPAAGDAPSPATQPDVRDHARGCGTPIPHVYVHLPFCANKCPYCDFNSHAGRDGEQARYGDALALEAQRWKGLVDARTVFVGGGTPTHGDSAQIERTLGGVVEALDMHNVDEFTVEANPGSLSREKVRALRRVGVNRVSLGVQSFSDARLQTLGRIHNASDAVRGIELLREGGIPRFSLDLMLAVPGQSLAEQVRDVRRALDLEPEHISAYVLTYEPGTAFYRALQEGRHAHPEAERELAHLHAVCDVLGEAGYTRYEISNFARGEAVCLHNLAYWRSADWLGLGAGAHAHVDGLRWKNIDDPAAYARAVESGAAPEAWREQVDAETRAFEMLMMGLRLPGEGVDLGHVARQSGFDVGEAWAAPIEEHASGGFIAREGDRVCLTSRGLDVANAVIATFVPER